MIKILLKIPDPSSWIGGLNYFVNLCEAVESLYEKEIEFAIFNENNQLPPPLCYYKSLNAPWTISRHKFVNIANRILYKHIKIKFNKNAFFDYLHQNDVRIFSHGFPLGEGARVPLLCWIPDFQHKYLPNFFSVKEIRARNEEQKLLSKRANGFIFSSNSALNDFKKFYPDSKSKTYVLHFVASPYRGKLPEADAIMEKYKIYEPFFYVPNQIWAHKNHIVILEALKKLNERGEHPLVISTGLTSDYRNPAFFSELKTAVEKAGLTERFRFLGLVDFADVSQLMRQSMCIINPSLFEGWSTTVEESKSLGKKILLSDIPVHREQAPERGMYFKPHDHETLSDLMLRVVIEYSPDIEDIEMEKATNLLPQRLMEFGNQYQSIIKDMLNMQD